MASMESVGANTLGLSHKEKRYTLPALPEDNPRIEEFLFGDLMKEIVGATLGANAYLLLELFSVKWPRTGTPFGWHQDSGYLLGTPHKPYLSLFCAVDNLTEENGCLRVLPYSRAESRSVVKHVKDRQTNDFVGHEGSDPGVALTVEAGGIIVMSSVMFHCSGTNLTDNSRRAFPISYSPEPITDAKGNLWNMAIPFLENGINVHGSATLPKPKRGVKRGPQWAAPLGCKSTLPNLETSILSYFISPYTRSTRKLMKLKKLARPFFLFLFLALFALPTPLELVTFAELKTEPAAGVRFAVSFPASSSGEALDGRLLLLISKEARKSHAFKSAKT